MQSPGARVSTRSQARTVGELPGKAAGLSVVPYPSFSDRPLASSWSRCCVPFRTCLVSYFPLSQLQPRLDSFDAHRQNVFIARLTAVYRHWRSMAIDHATQWKSSLAQPLLSLRSTVPQRPSHKGPGVSRQGTAHGGSPHLPLLISSQRNRRTYPNRLFGVVH